MAKENKLSAKQYMRAIIEVSKVSFKTAPLAVSLKLVGVVVDSILPIAVTYFAALTTTQLALAFSGDKAAGDQAIFYIIVTAALGLFTTVWNSIDQYVQALMRYRIEAKV